MVPSPYDKSTLRLRCAPLLAVLLASLSLAGEIARFAHLALVAHVTCAEHGEFVDAPAVASRLADSLERAGIEDASAPPGNHDHEDCAFWAGRDPRPGMGSLPPAPTRVPLSLPPCQTSARAAPARSHSLYRLAPKSSPPA